jgi:hypothetical protein
MSMWPFADRRQCDGSEGRRPISRRTPMPQYLALIYGPADQQADRPDDFQGEMMADYAEFGEAAAKAGVMAGGNALQSVETATTVSVLGGKGGEVVTTDGPFAETKEVLGGYYLLDCPDLDQAIAWAARIPGAWLGKVEVRPVLVFQ